MAAITGINAELLKNFVELKCTLTYKKAKKIWMPSIPLFKWLLANKVSNRKNPAHDISAKAKYENKKWHGTLQEEPM